MHRWGMLGELAAVVLALLSRTAALNLVGINGTELTPYIGKELESGIQEQASPIIQGACYSPFHLSVYPLYGGSAAGLDSAMDADFRIMTNYVKVVRTYYSSFYGYPVAPQAAKNGIQLYLGVFMTDESWYNDQVNAAVDAVKNYPNTIKAILVGNENIYPAGPYSASQVLTRVKALRARILSETGRTVNIGTVQRHNEWLSSSTRSEMLTLANGCDIIGVNIYPFFDVSYRPSDPLAMLNGAWNEMLSVFPSEKVRLTEIGYPTAGAPPSFAPYNTPSLANSISFYKAFLNWSPTSGGQEVFWFMFFDRRQDDNTMGIELEKYFGFYTANGAAKSSSFPNLAAAPTSAPTPAPTPAPTSAPVTSSQVCRVHKVFN